jgi:hypothetical protein
LAAGYLSLESTRDGEASMAKCTTVLILCLLALAHSARDGVAADALRKLRVAVTAISGGMSPP